MQNDLLQQLRDLHLPLEPAWWPPAPGWWLLAALLLTGLMLLGRALLARYRAGEPFRQARRLYGELYAAYAAGTVSAERFLHESNELLKRLLIFAVGSTEARAANDERWLRLLDELSGSRAFTEGPGQQLGNQRFQPVPAADIDALHPVLTKLFAAAPRQRMRREL